MAITGKLGTPDSQLGQIQFGSGTVSGAVGYDKNITESLASTLDEVLTVEVIPTNIKIRDISEELSGLSENLRLLTYNLRVNEELDLEEIVSFTKTVLHNISESLNLGQSLVGNLPKKYVANIVQKIIFYEQLDKLIVKRKDIFDSFNLDDEAEIRVPKIFNVGISENLNLSQIPNRRLSMVVLTTDLISFIEVMKPGKATSTQTYENFAIIEVIYGVKSKPVFTNDSFILNDLVTYQKILVRNINEQLNITENVGEAGTSFNRSIFESVNLRGGMQLPIRIGGLKVTLREVEYVKVPKKCFVTLECPLTSTVISLPCPQMGDTQKNLHSQVIKRSMNNVLYTYIRKNKLEELKYSFVIGTVVAQNLEDFCDINIGNVITLTNWKGEIWKVNITSNPIDFVAKSLFENEAERWEVSLEFQGVKILG